VRIPIKRRNLGLRVRATEQCRHGAGITQLWAARRSAVVVCLGLFAK